MVTIKDGCGCDPCDCDWKQKLKEAYARASVSVNKIGDYDGSVYFPDGSGFVKLPIPRLSEIQQISTNAQDIADLKVADVQLQANITAEETARKAKDENLDSDIARIDSTDARQSELIRDNADRITSTYNDLVSTEATVATHDSEIITLKANNQALAKSLVSDVIMTDGTTAGSVQVSIERKDGTLITSANYRWGKDIGIRLEAGTQAGYVKAVISLSDGTELVSNEYKIVEVLESDVYVTAITLVPDMTAGTIGGNISYSNGTTQTINSVNVPTAPGVTSAIEALQGRMTAVEQKNANQDASITAIDGRVQALENTPGIGQFANGRLGTIAGSTTDGRIKAEDDGTGSVNGWSALKQRLTTAEGQIVTAQNDISALDGTVAQQTTDINGLKSSKVSVAQGAANAGKALVVGSDGNVTVGDVGGDFKLYTGELSDLFEINATSFRLKKTILVRVIRGYCNYGTWIPTSNASIVIPPTGKEWLSSGTGKGNVSFYQFGRDGNNMVLFSIGVSPTDLLYIVSNKISISTENMTLSNEAIARSVSNSIDHRLNTDIIPNINPSDYGANNYDTLCFYTVYTL